MRVESNLSEEIFRFRQGCALCRICKRRYDKRRACGTERGKREGIKENQYLKELPACRHMFLLAQRL
jgi:hypothetical protein